MLSDLLKYCVSHFLETAYRALLNILIKLCFCFCFFPNSPLFWRTLETLKVTVTACWRLVLHISFNQTRRCQKEEELERSYLHFFGLIPVFHHSLFSKLLREVLDPYIDQTHHDLLLSRVCTPLSVQSYTQHLVCLCRQHSSKPLHFLLTQFSPVPTPVSGKVLQSEVRQTEEESQDVAVCCNSWKVSQQDCITAQRSKQAQSEHGAQIALAFVGRVTPPGGLRSFSWLFFLLLLYVLGKRKK